MGTVEKLSLPMLPKSRVESSLFITKSNPQDFVFLHTFLKSRRKVKGTFGALKGKEYGHVRSCMALYGLTRLCTRITLVTIILVKKDSSRLSPNGMIWPELI